MSAGFQMWRDGFAWWWSAPKARLRLDDDHSVAIVWTPPPEKWRLHGVSIDSVLRALEASVVHYVGSSVNDGTLRFMEAVLNDAARELVVRGVISLEVKHA